MDNNKSSSVPNEQLSLSSLTTEKLNIVLQVFLLKIK